MNEFVHIGELVGALVQEVESERTILGLLHLEAVGSQFVDELVRQQAYLITRTFECIRSKGRRSQTVERLADVEGFMDSMVSADHFVQLLGEADPDVPE